MRKNVVLLLTVCLFISGFSLAWAQEPGAGAPPKVLRIYREEVKPGKAGLHEKNEAAWTRAFVKAKYPAHYLAMTTMTGPAEAWFLEGHDSLASAEQAEQFIQNNALLKAEVEQLAQRDGEYLSGARGMVAVYRPELSYRADGIKIGEYRYFHLTTVRVRPGHDNDFIEGNKIVREAHEKANVPERWAVFQVTMGMPGQTYLIFQPLKSLAEVDAFPQTHGEAFRDAIGDEGRKRLRELDNAATFSRETNLFAFSSAMSYLSKEITSAAPDFWTPKPKAPKAAAPAAAKKEAAKPSGKP